MSQPDAAIKHVLENPMLRQQFCRDVAFFVDDFAERYAETVRPLRVLGYTVICHDVSEGWFVAFSPAERQAKRRAKLKTKGKVLFQAWVTKAQAARIRGMLASVTYHAPTPSRRKRRKPDPVQEKNSEIFEARQAAIRARLAKGEKATQIALLLNTLGFIGTGATVNRILQCSWYAPMRKKVAGNPHAFSFSTGPTSLKSLPG